MCYVKICRYISGIWCVWCYDVGSKNLGQSPPMTLLFTADMTTLLGDYIACFDFHQPIFHILGFNLLSLLQILLSGDLLEGILNLYHTALSANVL